YENVPLGYSKATAIDIILKRLNIPIENAYAIGDSMNDLPMLQAVPNSIAMGNAETLYPYVSYITTPIEENGIANALKHFSLI
ncbi:MAG: HAD hydrolase family protein, partial [Ruminococcus flavefaciens]|nr:HAD hydrolase family protein [Ruminococcus flavefaciens]